MSPRPRTVQDDVILDAALKVLGKIGTDRMTLADVGAEVGLSAATLVQRFGSKRELMLALFRHQLTDIHKRFESAIQTHDSPLDALFAAAVDRAGVLDGNVTLAHRLAFYLSQIEDPEFQALAAENSRRAIEGFKALLERAVEAGELSDGYMDTTQLAETIYSMHMGSLLTWSIANRGSLRVKSRRDLDMLIRPFRRGPRKASADSTDRPAERNTDTIADAR